MSGSWKLGTVAGIGIYVHWTFALLIGWVLLAGDELSTAVWRVALLLAVFACIVLHELGHALTARRFHIQTRDITLLPIGGVARLERMPDVPIQELWVAIAGPAVNVVIAIALAALVTGLSVVGWFRWDLHPEQSILVQLLVVNVMLVAFNLLPAFPMDGGRVLRALLAQRLDYVRATEIAAAVGQAMAVLFAMLAVLGPTFGLPFQPFLLFIALFIFLGAREEARLVQMRFAFQGLPVRAAMMTRFHALNPNDTVGHAADELLAGAQQDFPVVENDRVVGMVDRGLLMHALSQRGRDARIAEVMRRDCPTVQETEMLDKTFQAMREGGCSSVPVLSNQELVGLITLENVGELVMLQTALGDGRRRPLAARLQSTDARSR